MKIKHLKILAIMLATTTAAIAVADGDRRDGRHFDRPGAGMALSGDRLDRMANHLGLDDVQKQSLENIMAAATPEHEVLKARKEANREAMEALDSANPDYATQFATLAAEAGQLVTDGLLLSDRVHRDVEGVLTAEQREKMGEMRSSRSEHRDNRNKRGNKNRNEQQ